MQSHGFLQLIKSDTRVTEDSSTLIDLIFTNKLSNIVLSDVIETHISDHHMIKCIRKINHQKFAPSEIVCRNYKNYDPVKMNEDFSNID